MDIRARLHQMIDEILGPDPRLALFAYRQLSHHHLPWLEQRVVALARRERWPWARIGRGLGRSRQQVHREYRTIAATLPYDPDAAFRRYELDVQRLWADRLAPPSSAPEDEAVPW